MIRRTPLSRSRKPLRPRRDGSPSDRQKLKAEQARVTGAEYRSVYLEGVFKATGCDLCGRYRPPAHQHHARTGGVGRKADASKSVILCAGCHQLGHDKGFVGLLAAHGLPPEHLERRAAEHAAKAMALGYLPVEQCEECGKWHSKKWMLWEILNTDGSPLKFEKDGPWQEGRCRRICTACAPEGPP